MQNTSCCCKRDCAVAAIVASIIVAVVGVALSFMGTITVAPAFYWVTLGIAVVYLAVLLLASFLGNCYGKNCLCAGFTTLIAGILGTSLLSLVLLGTAVAAATPIGAVLNGLLLGFLALILTSVACIIKCAGGCDNGCNNG